jgi:hypothetical protein
VLNFPLSPAGPADGVYLLSDHPRISSAVPFSLTIDTYHPEIYLSSASQLFTMSHYGGPLHNQYGGSNAGYYDQQGQGYYPPQQGHSPQPQQGFYPPQVSLYKARVLALQRAELHSALSLSILSYFYCGYTHH